MQYFLNTARLDNVQQHLHVPVWLHSHRYGEFSADRNRQVKSVTRQEGRMLAVDGILVDEVTAVDAVYMVHESENLDRDRLLHVVNSARELLDHFRTSQLLDDCYVEGRS
jgi:hypothetical protein